MTVYIYNTIQLGMSAAPRSMLYKPTALQDPRDDHKKGTVDVRQEQGNRAS